jgi:hypothetical protein
MRDSNWNEYDYIIAFGTFINIIAFGTFIISLALSSNTVFNACVFLIFAFICTTLID